jgi:hypothetical protein
MSKKIIISLFSFFSLLSNLTYSNSESIELKPQNQLDQKYDATLEVLSRNEIFDFFVSKKEEVESDMNFYDHLVLEIEDERAIIVADYVKLNNENYPDLDQFDLEISINMMKFFLAFMSRMEIALKGIDYANGESLSSEELNLLMNNINKLSSSDDKLSPLA